jgi:hypothetical protein
MIVPSRVKHANNRKRPASAAINQRPIGFCSSIAIVHGCTITRKPSKTEIAAIPMTITKFRTSENGYCQYWNRSAIGHDESENVPAILDASSEKAFGSDEFIL